MRIMFNPPRRVKAAGPTGHLVPSLKDTLSAGELALNRRTVVQNAYRLLEYGCRKAGGAGYGAWIWENNGGARSHRHTESQSFFLTADQEGLTSVAQPMFDSGEAKGMQLVNDSADR